MEKRLVLPLCLLIAGLITVAICLSNSFNCISRQEASRIANDYSKEGGFSSFASSEVILTTNLEALITGKQKWIILMNGPDFRYLLLEIDAHTGDIVKTRSGVSEWPWQLSPMKAGNIISFLLVLIYPTMVVFSFLNYTRKTYRNLFRISLLLFLIFLVLNAVMGVLNSIMTS